jgi:large subunit ribosomal protein L14e
MLMQVVMRVVVRNEPLLGQVVKVLRGKEHDSYAVIVGFIDSRAVWIADGERRKFDQPKRKNVLHLELTHFVSTEVASSIQETGRVTNGKLRYALLKFLESNRAQGD